MKVEIMVVDDEAHTVRLVKRLLERAGYDVLAAYNADEAIRLLKDHDPKVMLLDIMMPGTPPGKVLEELKAGGRKTKVFYFSALKESHLASERIRLGYVSESDSEYVKGYIEKPFSNDDLVWRIREAAGAPDG